MTQAQFDALRGIQQQIESVEKRIIYWIEECRSAATPTIESVYGCQRSSAPAGWRFKLDRNVPVFRIPVHGEWFLDQDGEVAACCVTEWHEPRLILVKCKRLVYDILDEDRKANGGERFFGAAWEHVDIAEQVGTPDKVKYILSEPRVEE